MLKDKAAFVKCLHKYMISDMYKVNQSRILIVRKVLWISNSFATNASWCIQKDLYRMSLNKLLWIETVVIFQKGVCIAKPGKLLKQI